MRLSEFETNLLFSDLILHLSNIQLAHKFILSNAK